MYLMTLLACLATLRFASTLKIPSTLPEWQISEYSKLRCALHEILPLPHGAPPKPSLKPRSLPPDGATPMWMDGYAVYIHVYVGSPPQRVKVKVDSGSSITWIHGQDPEKLVLPDVFNTNLSTSWQPQNFSAETGYLDASACIADIAFENFSFTPDASQLEIPLGVDQSSRCIDRFRDCGILGLDLQSHLIQAFEKAKGNLSSVYSLAFTDQQDDGSSEGWFSLGGHHLDATRQRGQQQALQGIIQSPVPIRLVQE